MAAVLAVAVFVVGGYAAVTLGVVGVLILLLLVWYLVVPAWALVGRVAAQDWRLAPTDRQVLWSGGAVAILIVVVGTVYFSGWQGLGVGLAGGVALAAGLLAWAALFFAVAAMRRDPRPDSERALTNPTLVGPVLTGVFGTLAGLSSLFLLALVIAYTGILDMYNNGNGFLLREQLLHAFLVPIYGIGTPFVAGLLFGLAYRAMLHVGRLRAREKRRLGVDNLKGRLEDHYALHRVSEPTYASLRSSLMAERDDRVPGERTYIHLRSAVLMLTVLGVLFVLLGIGMSVAAASNSGMEPAPVTPVPEQDEPFAPCWMCETRSQYDLYRESVELWRTLIFGAAGLTAFFGVLLLILVPYAVRNMRQAKASVLAFWEARDRLEATMLEEVRHATAARGG